MSILGVASEALQGGMYLFGLSIHGVEVTQAIQHWRAADHLTDPADRGSDRPNCERTSGNRDYRRVARRERGSDGTHSFAPGLPAGRRWWLRLRWRWRQRGLRTCPGAMPDRERIAAIRIMREGKEAASTRRRTPRHLVRHRLRARVTAPHAFGRT